jgi:hypothetical protein
MKLGAFTCWLSDRPLEDTLIAEAPDASWWRAASDNNEGRPIDATLH